MLSYFGHEQNFENGTLLKIEKNNNTINHKGTSWTEKIIRDYKQYSWTILPKLIKIYKV